MSTKPELKSPLEQQPPFSQIIGQAYESYLSPKSNLPFNGSPNQLQSTLTQNPMNINNQNMNMPQIQPQIQQPVVMLSNWLPIGQSTPVPASYRSSNLQLPNTVSYPNITLLHMLFTNMEIMNKKL